MCFYILGSEWVGGRKYVMAVYIIAILVYTVAREQSYNVLFIVIIIGQVLQVHFSGCLGHLQKYIYNVVSLLALSIHTLSVTFCNWSTFCGWNDLPFSDVLNMHRPL